MPAGQSDVRERTRARFDDVLRRYTNPPSEKRKPKQPDELENVVLQSLRTNFTKDTEEDETVLNNTYDPAQGSPRYTKNQRREAEVSVKANLSRNVKEEKTNVTSEKKKSKRILPPPPLIENKEDDHQIFKSHASVDVVGKQKKKSKKGKRTVTDGKKGEKEPEDLLHEYQQRITQEEETHLKKSSQKKHETEPHSQEVVVLNNEFGKKGKKKKNLHECERDERELPSGQSQGDLSPEITKLTQDDEKEETENATNPRGKRKKKKEVKDSLVVEASLKPMFDDSLILGVYIHRTDRLKTDLQVSHPMVKIHVVDEITGQYVKKENSHRRVSSFYEQENIEHILPIITQPFDFKKHKSTVPEWEEQIIFNERLSYFLQANEGGPRVILFFEVLDFITMEEAKAKANGTDAHVQGFRTIAWAFLKLVGTNGMLNIDSKLRLQLYNPPPRVRKNPQTVEVFQWWLKFHRNRYASTLYITVKGLNLPDHVNPSMRSMMALQQERGSTSYSELHTELTQKYSTQVLEDKSDAVTWSRMPGQVCRIPNKPMLSFRGGRMGCFTLRFSYNGRALAAACADRDAFPIVVYEIPSGKVKASFNGHLSIVYDLCWARDDRFLLSASSDGTVRVWNMEIVQSLAQKILPHPSFVYCAQYHPLSQNLVVTGGYDCLLRVWSLDTKDVNGQLLQEFEGHKTFINALCFDSEGLRMFSADNAGLIIVWSTKVEHGSHIGPTRFWKIEREIKESDLNGIPVNSLEVHPNGRRLLIHAKDSILRVMDLRILSFKKYIGATNYRERISSTFTPCGSFIFSGSEDGLAYVWNAETGDQVAVYSELCYPTALRGVAFHPHDHIVAFCAFGQSQPIQLYQYDRKVTHLEIESMRVLNRTDTTLRNQADLTAIQDASTSGMDRFASVARISLKMQRVKQKLDSVLVPNCSTVGMETKCDQGSMSQLRRGTTQEASNTGLQMSLPPPSLLSPHSKLQLPRSLSAQLIPQASLSSQALSPPAFGHSIKRAPSLQKSLQDPDFSLHVDTKGTQVQQTVVALYDYSAERSDELTIRRGDVILVLYKDNVNWWFGRLITGEQGYFLAAYVADEKDFDEKLSRAFETEPGHSEHISQEYTKSKPTKLTAAISASGELKIISEHDTDAEATSARIKKKKKVKKKISQDPPCTPSLDAETSVPAIRKKRPLPRLGETNNAFEHDATQ